MGPLGSKLRGILHPMNPLKIQPRVKGSYSSLVSSVRPCFYTLDLDKGLRKVWKKKKNKFKICWQWEELLWIAAVTRRRTCWDSDGGSGFQHLQLAWKHWWSGCRLAQEQLQGSSLAHHVVISRHSHAAVWVPSKRGIRKSKSKSCLQLEAPCFLIWCVCKFTC